MEPKPCEKQRACVRKRRAWAKSVGIPWPKSADDVTPPPATLDLPEIEPEG